MKHQDAKKDQADPQFALFACMGIIFIGITLYTFLFSKYKEEISSAAYTSAEVTRYVHYPVAWLYSEHYKKLIYEMPKIRKHREVSSFSQKEITIFVWVPTQALAYIIALIFLPRALIRYVRRKEITYSRCLGFWDLLKLNAKSNPRIAPAINQNLATKNPYFGPWATQLSPLHVTAFIGALKTVNPKDIPCEEDRAFAEYNLDLSEKMGLPKIESSYPTLEKMRFREYRGVKFPSGITQRTTCESHSTQYAKYGDTNENDEPIVSDVNDDALEMLIQNPHLYYGCFDLDVPKIQQHMVESLGPLCKYTGPYIDINYLPRPERAIWMIMCTLLTQEKKIGKQANKLMDDIAESFKQGENYNGEEIDLSGVNELFDSVRSNFKVKACLLTIADQHAYYYTAFTALWDATREAYARIMIPDFRWLKPTNRTLYLALLQGGMEVARPECAGIRGHYFWEKKCRRRIPKPQIDLALLARTNELEDEGWIRTKLTHKNEWGEILWEQKQEQEQEQEKANEK